MLENTETLCRNGLMPQKTNIKANEIYKFIPVRGVYMNTNQNVIGLDVSMKNISLL